MTDNANPHGIRRPLARSSKGMPITPNDVYHEKLRTENTPSKRTLPSVHSRQPGFANDPDPTPPHGMDRPLNG